MKNISVILIVLSLYSSIYSQTVETIASTDYVFEESAISDNGNYLTISYSIDGSDDGVTQLFQKETDGTWTLLHEYPLVSGTGGSDSVESLSIAITNTGISYSIYSYDQTDNVRIQKNLPNGSYSVIIEIQNNPIKTLAIGDYLYVLFEEDDLYDIMKLDSISNQVLWTTNISNVFEPARNIVQLPDGNIGVEAFNMVELWYILKIIDISTGNIIESESKPGQEAFIRYINNYKICQYQITNSNFNAGDFLTIKNLNDDSFFKTDWHDLSNFYQNYHNLFANFVVEVNIFNDKVMALTIEDEVIILSKEMVHGYIKKIIDNSIYGASDNRKINDDESITLITHNAENTFILNIVEPEENMSLLPTLNVVPDDHIVMVYNSQELVNGQFVPAYHKSLLVFEDGYIPEIIIEPSGDLYPDSNWLTPGNNTTLYSIYPFSDSIFEDEDVVYRATYKNNDDSSHKINIKIHCVEESMVSVADYSIDKISIYPNPASDFITIKTKQNIAEILIYNDLGQLIMFNQDKHTINISMLNKGLYFVRVKDENATTFFKKIVKI